MEPRTRSPNKGKRALDLETIKTIHLEINPRRGGRPASESSITITASRVAEWEDITLAKALDVDAFKVHIAEKTVIETKI